MLMIYLHLVKYTSSNVHSYDSFNKQCCYKFYQFIPFTKTYFHILKIFILFSPLCGNRAVYMLFFLVITTVPELWTKPVLCLTRD